MGGELGKRYAKKSHRIRVDVLELHQLSAAALPVNIYGRQHVPERTQKRCSAYFS